MSSVNSGKASSGRKSVPNRRRKVSAVGLDRAIECDWVVDSVHIGPPRVNCVDLDASSSVSMESNSPKRVRAEVF
jgi:hypothetical protein